MNIYVYMFSLKVQINEWNNVEYQIKVSLCTIIQAKKSLNVYSVRSIFIGTNVSSLTQVTSSNWDRVMIRMHWCRKREVPDGSDTLTWAKNLRKTGLNQKPTDPANHDHVANVHKKQTVTTRGHHFTILMIEKLPRVAPQCRYYWPLKSGKINK